MSNSSSPKRRTPQASGAKRSPSRTVVIVLGMHRSGTSAMARVLNLAGLTLPERLMQAAADNERGFWEPLELVEANDRFLKSVNLKYDMVAEFPADFEKLPSADELRLEILRVLRSVPGRNPIVIKDPRVSRLMPIWRRTLEDEGYTIKIVIISRNPIEVVESLRERSNFSKQKALFLWLCYNLDIEQYTRDLPRAFTTYARMLDNWENELNRIRIGLKLKAIRLTDVRRAEIDAFLSTDLRHNNFKLTDAFDDPEVSPWIKCLTSGFEQAAAGDESPLREVSDQVRNEIGQALPEIGKVVDQKDGQIYAVDQSLKLYEQQLTELQREMGSLRQEREHLEERAQIEEQRATGLEKQMADAKTREDALEGKLEEQQNKNDSLNEERDAYEQQLTELQREMESLRQEREHLEERAQIEGQRATGLEKQMADAKTRQDALEGKLEEQQNKNDSLNEERDAYEQQLTELQREMESLRQEREHLEERKQIEELRATDLEKQTADAQALLSAVESELAQRKAENADLYFQRDAYEEQLTALQREMESLRQKCEHLEEQAERSRLEAALAQELGTELAKQAAWNRGQNDHLNKALSASRDDQQKLKAQVGELGAKLDGARRSTREIREALEGERAARADSDSALAQERAAKAETLQALEGARAAHAKMERALERERLAYAESVAQFQAEARAARDTFDHMRVADEVEIRKLRSAIEQADSQVSLLRGEREQLENKLADSAAVAEGRTAELAHAHSRQSELAAQISAERIEWSDQRKDIQSARHREEIQRHEWERRAEWLAEELKKQRGLGYRLSRGLMRRSRIGRTIAMIAGLYSPGAMLGPRRLATLAAQSEVLRNSKHFDPDYYMENNWDVRTAGADPALHYLLYGANEGRHPSARFDTRFYLNQYPDVRASGLNPLIHYIHFGASEGRFPKPALRIQEYDPLRISRDPYDIRPDEYVAVESARGQNFLDRFGLLGDAPNYAGAVASLNTVENDKIVRPGSDVTPEASIVIPIYGQLPYTLNCLDSLKDHASRYGFEVLVYDDCSPDDVSERFLRDVNWVRYERAPRNSGFIASCNAGATLSTGRIYVMLNNDTRVVPGWLDELVGSFELFPEAGLVGSKLFYPDGTLQEAGGIVWRDGSAWNYGRNDDPNKPEYCHARQVDYVSGAAIAVRADLWNVLGGFDGDSYERAYYEDTDLAFRMREAGHQVWMQALSRVIHYEGKTSGTDEGSGEKAYQAANRTRFLNRWKDTLLHHGENAYNPWREATRGSDKLALLIDATTPTPDKDSGSLDLVNLFTILHRIGYGCVFAPEDNMLFYGNYTQDLQRRGVQCLYHPYNLPLEPFLEAHGLDFDAAILHRLEPTTKWFDKVRKTCPNATLVFNTVDLHHLRARREANISGDRSLAKRAEEIAAREFGLIKRADSTIVVSSVEAALIKDQLPDAQIVHLPLMREIPGRKIGFDGRSGIVFLGGFAHTPNVDAVEYLLNDIWPVLRERLPHLHLSIAGSKMPAQIQQLAEKCGATPIGFVEHLGPFFESARLLVAPLRYGAGAKGKVISSLAHGVPVVGTTIAAEGMGLENATCVSIADDTQQFIEEVVRLHETRDDWEQASVASIEFAQAHHCLGVGQELLKQLLQR